jgi:hypothetical protein
MSEPKIREVALRKAEDACGQAGESLSLSQRLFILAAAMRHEDFKMDLDKVSRLIEQAARTLQSQS